MNYMLHFVSFQQKTVTNYLAKEKSEPFPKPTPFSKQKTVTNYLAKEKTERRGPDPVGDKSGRGTKWPHGPFWGSREELPRSGKL